MELITYTKPNPNIVASPTPQIRLALKEKKIYFNSRAISILGLRLDRSVLFHQNKNNLKDWYLEIVENGGMKIFGTKKHSLRCNSTEVIKRIFLANQFQWKTGYVIINKTPLVVNGRKLFKLNFSLLKN